MTGGCQELGEEGHGELVLNSYTVWENEKSSGDGWWELLRNHMYLISLNCALKMVRIVDFYVYLTTVKNIGGRLDGRLSVRLLIRTQVMVSGSALC